MQDTGSRAVLRYLEHACEVYRKFSGVARMKKSPKKMEFCQNILT